MDAKRARIGSEEARRWHQAGLVTAEAHARIQQEYETHLSTRLDRSDGASYGALALYGAAGALLGAACLVLVGLGDFGRGDPYVLLALGALLGAGGGAAYRLASRRELGDALVVAALVPWTAAPFPDEALRPFLSLFALAAPVVLLAFRRSLLPLLAATVAFTVAAAMASFEWTGDIDRFATSLWFGLSVVWLAGLVLLARVDENGPHPWVDPVLTIATAALVAPTIGVLYDVVDLSDSEAVELALGAVQLAWIFLGLAIRQRGLVIGGAAVLTVDALVFAFDVGGLLLGMGALIATAIGLLVLASALRGRERGPGPGPGPGSGPGA